MPQAITGGLAAQGKTLATARESPKNRAEIPSVTGVRKVLSFLESLPAGSLRAAGLEALAAAQPAAAVN